jgi:large subunit ribosomal protein L15
MASLEKLTKITARSKKRVGRGYGSGKGGHTSSRGAKGRKARGSVALSFTGTKTKKSFIARLPLQRGKGKFKAKLKPEIISLSALSVYKEGETVTLESLIKKGIASKKALKTGVKILNNGKLEKNLEIKVNCSKSVKNFKKIKNKKEATAK